MDEGLATAKSAMLPYSEAGAEHLTLHVHGRFGLASGAIDDSSPSAGALEVSRLPQRCVQAEVRALRLQSIGARPPLLELPAPGDSDCRPGVTVAKGHVRLAGSGPLGHSEAFSKEDLSEKSLTRQIFRS